MDMINRIIGVSSRLMAPRLFWILICFVCLATVSLAQAQQTNRTIKVMTYNLKFASPTFEPSWEVRRDMQLDLIRKYDPDIIGTQEGLKEQIDYLEDHLPDYVMVGEGRKGGDDDEHMAIFYKRDKFRLREMQSFALSKTPELLGSGPDVNPRMVTWVRLAYANIASEGKSGTYPQDYRGHWEDTQEFYLFNTHFFNGKRDSLARHSASKLIMDRVRELDRFGAWTAERPVILMGDFNCRPGSTPYEVLVDATGAHGFKNAYEDPKKIDWILYKGNMKVLQYEDIDYHVDGVYPSDHKPVYAEFEIVK